MLYIDIDGVLNDYPESYIEYLSKANGRNFDTTFEAKVNIPYYDYTCIREGYRREIEPYLRPNDNIIRVLNCSPYENIIVTKRPIYKYQHMHNTMNWLKRSRLRYQHLVYWNKDILSLNIPYEVRYCKAAVEDNIKVALFLIRNFGYPVFVIKTESNKKHIKELEGFDIQYGNHTDLIKFFRSF